MATIALGFAILSISILGSIAAYLWWKVYQQSKSRKALEAEQAQALFETRERLSEDVRFIAKAMMSEQCEMTEGCMRLKVILDLIDQRYSAHPRLKRLQDFYALVSHYPTHEAYKALDKKARFALDSERLSLENAHKASVYEEVHHLVSFSLDWIKEVPQH